MKFSGQYGLHLAQSRIGVLKLYKKSRKSGNNQHVKKMNNVVENVYVDSNFTVKE
jgi:hypothetical protein